MQQRFMSVDTDVPNLAYAVSNWLYLNAYSIPFLCHLLHISKKSEGSSCGIFRWYLHILMF